MKAYLLHRDRDIDLEQPLPAHAEALEQDLELPTLFGAMARDDPYLRDLVERVLLSSLGDPDAIRYRQEILADCLEQAPIVRELYSLAVEGVESKQKARFFWLRGSPDSVLQKSLGILDLLVEVVKGLRDRFGITIANGQGALKGKIFRLSLIHI